MREYFSIQVINIGTSKGIRIPSRILKRLKFKKKVSVVVTDNELILRAEKKPREGWVDDAKRCHKLGEDKLLIPDILDTHLWNDI